jgi:hypothetical protein
MEATGDTGILSSFPFSHFSLAGVIVPVHGIPLLLRRLPEAVQPGITPEITDGAAAVLEAAAALEAAGAAEVSAADAAEALEASAEGVVPEAEDSPAAAAPDAVRNYIKLYI